MTEALTVSYLIAALVLCAAGVAKLRRPEPAARALGEAGLPGGTRGVRAFAVCELALAAWAGVAPSRLGAITLCSVFVLFTVLGGVLARRASSCGCFGASNAPATLWQSLLSGVFALALGIAGALGPAEHGVGWLLGRPAAVALALAVGLIGAAYATVLAYTALPVAWSAWEHA